MRLDEINIRDPFILPHDGKYYLYGTRAETCWGEAEGFDCYVSADLRHWEGPREIFRRPEGFWATRNYWAPECVHLDGRFYLITTFGGEGRKGIQILASAHPTGPFVPLTRDVITPVDWTCIDGTVFMVGEQPHLIFSHSFEDDPDGVMCAMPLSRDLRAALGEPRTLFTAKDAPWAHPIPFAKEEFGMEGAVYFTDGPAVHRRGDGSLVMLWSSWGARGYAVGAAVSDSGELYGPWRHLPTPVFAENGGHGMLFTTHRGALCYVLHSPNERGQEHPVIFRVAEGEEGLTLQDGTLN